VDFAGRFQEDDLVRMLQIVSELELNLGRVSEPQFWLELTVMKLVKMASTVALEDLMGRLEGLEGLLKGRETTRSRQPDRKGSPPQKEARAAPPVAETAARDREPPTGGEVTLKVVQAGWDALVQGVKAQKISVGTFLAAGSPRALKGRQLDVFFDRSSTFHANQVTRNREAVEAAVAKLFGAKLRVVCRLDGDAASQAEDEDRAEADERVQMALRIFDGEVLRR
jgi:DNA polymerase III gamma/tau subunit